MSLRKIFKSVKEDHIKSKDKADKSNIFLDKNDNADNVKIHKNSQRGIGIKDDFFPENIESQNQNLKSYKVEKGDTLKSISKKLFGSEKYWMGFHLKNIHKIPNPLRLIEGMILEIPLGEELHSKYNITSKSGNYIIQDKDNIKSISTKIFGSDKNVKKIIDWGFLKFTKDIYPSKEIIGLKYLDLDRQIKNLQIKYNLNPNLDYKNSIIEVILKISKNENTSPLIPLLISNLDNHWFEIQTNKDIFNNDDISFNLGSPLSLDVEMYNNYFPRLSMDIEYNIIFGIKKIKELRVKNKNWPKAIVAYFMSIPPGIGKPEEQKIKVQEAVKIIDSILLKMNNKELSSVLIKKTESINNEYISFDLLKKELIEYKNTYTKKYN